MRRQISKPSISGNRWLTRLYIEQTNEVLWVNVLNLKKPLTLFGRRIIQIQVVAQFKVLAGRLEDGWA